MDPQLCVVSPNITRRCISPRFARTQLCALRGREVEHPPRNDEVPGPDPWNGCQVWDCSLALPLAATAGVVPRKQNREIMVGCIGIQRHFNS